MLGNNDVDAGINRVASLMAGENPRLFIDPSCKNLIREIKSYRWDEWANRKQNTKKQLKAAPKKKDDHAVDALRYLVMSRPYFDTGNGPVFQKPEQEYYGSTLYATSSLNDPSAGRDWRAGSSWDSDLGSDW